MPKRNPIGSTSGPRTSGQFLTRSRQENDGVENVGAAAALKLWNQNAKRATCEGRPSANEFVAYQADALAELALVFSAFWAALTNSPNAAASWAAMSASTLRSSAILAAFNPSMKRL